jgi:hypothetical protein
MPNDLTELEAMRIGAAVSAAGAQLSRRFGAMPDTGVYSAAQSSIGTGWEYDEDGNVITPGGGYWKAGMAVASAPIRS